MIIPCGHRLVVKVEKIEDIDPVYASAKKSGLVLADHEDRRREQAGTDKGTVIAIGPTAFKDFGGDAWCDVNDFIVFAKYAGKAVTDPDTLEQLLVINDEDVVAIVRKEND